MVSVIMIFLDAERFMAEAVESIFAQSYAAWELILVDDGSTDASSALARDLAAAHPERIRYLQHPGRQNRGMSASRNLGIREARGEFIAFLDADDCWPPGKLAEQVAILRRHPDAAMVYGRGLIWHSWTGEPQDQGRDHHVELGVPADTLVAPPTLFHLLLENRFQTPMTGNAILRRDVVRELGGFEDAFHGMYEDQVFFFKVHLAYPVYVSNSCWLMYRQHPESCTNRPGGGDYHAGRRPLLEWLAGYLSEQSIPPSSGVWRAVKRERWRARHPRLHRQLSRLGALRQKWIGVPAPGR